MPKRSRRITYTVIEGLKRGADVSKYNMVQAEELSAYISNLARKLTDDSQQPVFSESGDKDLVIGTVRGAEPVPPLGGPAAVVAGR